MSGRCLKMSTHCLLSVTHSRQNSTNLLVGLMSLQLVKILPFIYFHMTYKPPNITAFYFNFERAIFGEFIPCPISDELPIPYPYFIATPLLPCGGVNGGVRKFTGNGEIGSAVDDITKTAHAFVHFSLLYSLKNILFCDLQGKCIRMCEHWSYNGFFNRFDG